MLRRFLWFLLVLCAAGKGLAATAPAGNRINVEGKGSSLGDGAISPRTGGEDIGSAVLIQYLPFSDTGVTCGFVNNYDEVCPYTGSTSPDVVYKYTPASQEGVIVDLCASQYDTKVYVYAGGVGNLIACNDDAGCGYSGWQSKISRVNLTAGLTYYFVIDGYGGSCGSYTLSIVAGTWGCPLQCPGGAVHEGEPSCGPNYVDSYNGGCNSDPPVFQPLTAQEQGCVDLCGLTGTYIYQGMSYRDTDWFEIVGTGETVTASCITDYWPLQFLFIYNTDCNDLQYEITGAAECQEVTLSRIVPEGLPQWLWVGPQVFDYYPCEWDFTYVLHVCGIAGVPPVPARETSWGMIKSRYRE